MEATLGLGVGLVSHPLAEGFGGYVGSRREDGGGRGDHPNSFTVRPK